MRRTNVPSHPDVTASTRRAFIDAYHDLCQTHPGPITAQEVARRAGYNRCTFYEYFTSVWDVHTQLEDEVIDYICAQIARTDDYIDIVDRFVEVIAKDEGPIRYASVLLTANYVGFPQRLKAVVLPVLLDQFHPSVGAIPAEYVLDFYLSGLISMAGRWFSTGRVMPAEELGDLIRVLLSDGVLHALS